jgi:hypothetical protein
MIASMQAFRKSFSASLLFCLYAAIAVPQQNGAKQAMQLDQSTAFSQKYRRVFFPGGMPSSEDPFSGTVRKSLYAFYEEATLEPFKAVLYSQEVPSDPGHDASFTVHIALLERGAGHWNISQDLDITSYIPVQTEFPGNFLKMDARLNSFVIDNSKQGLHVNLWAILSGTGSISGASDLIYTLNSDNKLHLILALGNTSKHSHLGMKESQTEDSRILIGDIDNNGSTEIIVENVKLIVNNEQKQSISKTATVYKYVNGIYQSIGALSAESAAKLSSLSVLPRSKSIPAVSGQI